MKAIPVLLTIFAMFILPLTVVAQECVPEPVQIIGGGRTTTGFVSDKSYISVVFDEPLDELWIVGINVNYPYEMLYQGVDGFSAIVYADETNTKYSYIAGGYRCQTVYRVRLPLMIH